MSLAFAARAEFTCELSFPHAPSTALANFPVLVRLAEDAPTGFHYTDCQTAANLWFTDSNNVVLPFDVDTWDTTGESLVWVSVPLLSSTATITMHWDSSGAPAGQPDSTNVWSRASYVGVWHMNELVYDSVKAKHYTPDASASGWNAYKVTQSDAVPAPVTTATGVTANTTPLTGTAMNIAYGAGKDNAAFGGFAVPMAQTSSFTLGGSGFTLSAIVNSQQGANNGRCRVIAFGSAYNEMANLSVGCDNIYVMGETNHLKANPRGQTDWVYSAGVFNSPRSKIYADGVCLSGSSEGNPSLASLSLTKGIGLGCFIDGKNTLDGYLDEARIRNVASTGEWIAEEYKTVTTANYVSFGKVDTGVEVLRLGAVAVSDVTPTNAVVTGELRTLGEGATSADVWLVYTDGGATTNRIALGAKNAEPSVLSATLENLAEKTTYTCWFTATNNLSAGADSATASFKTKRIPTGSGIFECELSFPSAPATALANFPVLVRLANDAPEGFLYENCPTAANLWFTDEYDTVLPFEADTWNTAGESLVWVSVPSFSTSTKITMHWSDDLGNVEDSPAAREVWTRANYNAVWHFSGSNAESVTNLAPATIRGTPTYNGNAGYPGPVGKTLWLDGSSDLRYTPDAAWTTLGTGAALSVSFWVRHTGANPAFTRMVSCMSAYSAAAGYEVTLQNSFTKITVGSSSSKQLTTDITAGPNAQWKHFTGTYAGTAIKFYDDGVKKGEGTGSGVSTPTEVLTLGSTGGTVTGNTLTGGLDEVRIRREASSPEWVAAEYATMATENYVAFGEVEEAAVVSSFEFGVPSVSSVSATGATVSARLKGLGDNATSANLWLVVTGFGQTRTYPLDPATEAQVVAATVSGLQPGAEWTAYLTATNNLGAGVASSSAAFTTTSDAGSGSPGLYQAVTLTEAPAQDAAASWDIAASGVVTLGPLAMRSSGNNHDYWTSADGTVFQWADNTGYGYAGYMYMEGGKDYYFGASADDRGYIWLDNGAANWDAKRTASQFGSYGNWNRSGPYAIAETGYYRVVFAGWNVSGGAGAEPADGKVPYPKMRYAALESGAAAPAQSDSVWQEAVDPGDGSLFLPEKPTRSVAVLSAARDGALLSARVALGEAFPGESSVLRYVYGATNGGNDPADWEGGSLVASSLPATAVTNDYIVGIAANTRYVRFYTQDGDALNWSATISLDWASEGSIAGGLIFLGDPEVSSVVADSAVLSAVLNAPGDDATEAEAWFVVTGGGETKVIPAGTATDRTNLTVTVTGLTPETAYTFYATATNNAATPVGADSATGTFTTGNAETTWEPANAKIVFDGRVITAKVPVTNVGLGTTTIYLMTGAAWNAENNAIATNVVSGAGVQTLVADISSSTAWGNTVWYSLKLVVVTNGVETIDWPYQNGQVFYNKSYQLKDDSTYTWVGGSAGVWNVPANWERTTAGGLAPNHPSGYPVYGSTAVFATEEGDGPVTVTIPATQGTTYDANDNLDKAICWWITTLDFGGMHSELVFTSEDKTAANCQFRVYTPVANQTHNRLVFDDCNVYLYYTKDVGATAAAEDGSNASITLKGGTKAKIKTLGVGIRPGFKLAVEDGATISPFYTIDGGSTALPLPVMEIDGCTVSCLNQTSYVRPDNYNNAYCGMLLRLKGAGASFTGGYFAPQKAASTNVVEFVIPAGGYSAVPVRTTNTSASSIIGETGAKAPMTFRVAADSPGLKNIPRRGIQLVQSAAGINAANVKFEDVKPNKCGFFFKDADGNEYADAAAIEAAGKTPDEIKEIWYRNIRGGFSVIVL